MTRYVLRSARPTQSSRLNLAEDLNSTQRAAVLAGTGPILIIAGAGSGKTHTLTYRAAYLLETTVSPENILLCTFTNRAAKEMISRVESLLGCDLKLWAGTFHHIANLALRHYADRVGLDADYSILDREDARDLMAAALAEEGKALRERRYPQPNLLLNIWSAAINRCASIPEILRTDAPQFTDLAQQIEIIGQRYQARKLQLNLVDYDDLLLFFHQILAEHDDAAERFQKRFEHVLVDEYQDTNKLQGQIIDLCVKKHQNLTVVGDDAQSIYAFRGAHFENIIDFPKRYPDAQVFKLEENYRSTPEILALANRCIRNNARQFPKILRATRPSKMQPVLLPLNDVAQQAEFVAQRILELHQEEQIKLSQIAVLYRAHAHSLELQVELTKRKIPFRVRSGLRFFEQAHIKDIIAHLRVVQNTTDALAWQRLLRTWAGMGKKSAEEILKVALSQSEKTNIDEFVSQEELFKRLPTSGKRALKSLSTLFKTIGKDSSLEEMIRIIIDGHYRDFALSAFPNAKTRIEDLLQLADYARNYESLERFLSELSLVSGLTAEAIGPGDAPDDQITLTTIHQAKGLEWRAVFLLGLSEGRFPQAMAVKTQPELEEERRLFYVATTRAKDHLYLCYPRFDESPKGPRRILRLSRFVDELNEDRPAVYERWEIVEES